MARLTARGIGGRLRIVIRHDARLLYCSADLLTEADAPLPTEFRLFADGANETTKGTFVLDPGGLAEALADFKRRGVDLPIDLEHDALSEDARAARADAGDARGWFKLEARDGELWAVDVTWTPDGERRLRDRTQRYISPVFAYDDEGRIVGVRNCALTAMPATLGAVPLVAASEDNRGAECRLSEGSNMDPKIIKEALDVLEAGDEGKALELLKGIVAAAAGGGEVPAETPPAVEESADAPPEESAPGEKDDEEQARTVATSQLSDADAAELAMLRAERLERDAAERRTLIGSLVQLGAEAPATAWDGSPEKRVPVKRLAEEPLKSLRARVAVLRQMNPQRVAPRPDTDALELTDGERAHMAKLRTQEEKDRYLALRASRKGFGRG